MDSTISTALEKVDKIEETLKSFRTLFTAFEPGFIKMADDNSRKAFGLMTKRDDYEIYELDIEKDFCTIHHAHKLAYELHLVIHGKVNIKQDGHDNILSTGQSLTTSKGLLHTFIALEDTKIVTIAVPTLNEKHGD